ncbi:IMPACT family protein [Desulfoluna butyratoxydans]|uniref:Ribosomal protein s5 domain 2-type fold n=1 Tax=Desulfoluna butyratoxydans TaxID=231438 RepID=A0A4U8YPJ7_9BACT|nr:YigZ family protein [Desulfoluna butyratoxydans]VFQ45624.1 ribosomal protein s5 domain 2-type fold [Desulfoluna butyratoxydans]
MDGYRVPVGRHRVEEKIGGSLFIATAERVSSAEEAKGFVDAMKREFRDATHNCHAFVAGPPGASASGMGDDGEPRGTAGPPMHQVLVHCGIGEIAVVVTRYYGGTKLGTGGLVRAYGGMVKRCLEEIPTTFFATSEPVALTVAYADLSAVKREVEAHGGEVLSELFTAVVGLSVRLPEESKTLFLERVSRMATMTEE